MEQALARTDDVYTWFMHNPADHFTFAVADDWRKEAALSKDQRLVRDPARVTFRIDPPLDSLAYGIRHDRAYWLGGMRSRTGGPATVDVHAQGCGRRLPLTKDGETGAGPAPVPWVSRAAVPAGSRATTARSRIAATLTGVSALTVDVRRTCLAGRVEYRIVSDGPAVLSLSDGRRVALRAGVNEGIVAAPRGR